MYVCICLYILYDKFDQIHPDILPRSFDGSWLGHSWACAPALLVTSWQANLRRRKLTKIAFDSCRGLCQRDSFSFAFQTSDTLTASILHTRKGCVCFSIHRNRRRSVPFSPWILPKAQGERIGHFSAAMHVGVGTCVSNTLQPAQFNFLFWYVGFVHLPQQFTAMARSAPWDVPCLPVLAVPSRWPPAKFKWFRERWSVKAEDTAVATKHKNTKEFKRVILERWEETYVFQCIMVLNSCAWTWILTWLCLSWAAKQEDKFTSQGLSSQLSCCIAPMQRRHVQAISRGR